jgi:hypothetical protein
MNREQKTAIHLNKIDNVIIACSNLKAKNKIACNDKEILLKSLN